MAQPAARPHAAGVVVFTWLSAGSQPVPACAAAQTTAQTAASPPPAARGGGGGARVPHFLLLRGAKHGEWAPPKGHLCAADADAAAAALRELREETGICLAPGGTLRAGFAHAVTYALPRPTRKCPAGVTHIRFFLAELPPRAALGARDAPPRVRLSHEHVGAAWLPLQQAAAAAAHGEMCALLAVASAHIASHAPAGA